MTEQKSDRPLLDLIDRMTADSVETSTLDAKSLMLVRIAALVAVHAPPASYLLNLAAASRVGIDADTARAVLVGIAPVVGTPAVMAAAGNIARALGIAIEMLDMEETST
jgi:alkylhydroperoxidase/carboxymuconolactone decarboxylase family protein YurZ